MLLSVDEFRQKVRFDLPSLLAELQSATGRGGGEELQAWESSLPALANALAEPAFDPLYLYFTRNSFLTLEYQLPAASSWCDVVLLGRGKSGPNALIVELKHWITRGDRPGPAEGLMERSGQFVLHPADQVRGYTEYCQRFHSTVQDWKADVRGCVLFTRDDDIGSYLEPPNDRLVRDYPCFPVGSQGVREEWQRYVAQELDTGDERFARAFVTGRYRQNRGFVSQIGAQIRDRENSPFVLLDHQRRAFALVQARLDTEVLGRPGPKKQVMVIQGPPGSGKSVLAARIWVALVTDGRLPEGDVVLTTTSTAQTSNWARLFQEFGGSRAAGGVVKRAASYVPVTTQTLGRLRRKFGADFASDAKAWRENVQVLLERGVLFQDGARDDQYLVSIVDEAHALINPEHVEGRGQFGFAPTMGPLAWHIIRCSTVSIFLLDAEQGFRDRENTTLEDIRRWAGELGAEVGEVISLEGAQFRCAGSTEYVAWVEALLRGEAAERLAVRAQTWRRVFDVELMDTPAALEQRLRDRADEGRTVRLVASYARPWKTKGKADPHGTRPEERDFYEPYQDESGAKRYWSKVWNFIPQNGNDYTWFIQAPQGSRIKEDPLCEVGCPYAVRGFDFDYVGVIWLSDLVRRDGAWRADPTHVHETGLDRSLRAARAERSPGPAREKLRGALVRAYRILLTRGIHGCYLWIEDPETRHYVRACLGLGGV
uniref:DUF2075 domain-containing protein n=1 Tax=Desulfacinum infernum TaxID=35837 RepID=A0A832A428_9BACT